MRTLVVGSSYLGDSSVGGHHDDWSLITFKSSVKERVALDIEHMHLIDEEDTWHDLSSSFLSPLGNFLVDLLSDFWFDLTNVSSEKSHKSLSSRIDDIDLVKGDSMNNLLSLLELSFRALHISSLWTSVVKIAASGEGPSKF